MFNIVLGDFNARSSAWWSNDTTNNEGTQIECLTSLYGFEQMISEPTHMIQNSSSCIDLMFINQPHLVIESGVHPSLHSKCHHQIIFCKLNLKIHYPPPYQRLVWNFKKANKDLIQNSLRLINWQNLFLNKNVHQQAKIFTDTILNIFSNFVPNKTITINDSDPPWMDEDIRNKINEKNELYKKSSYNNYYHRNWLKIQRMTTEISDLIITKKDEYYNRLSKRLSDPNTSAKTYWSILKTFYNGKKVPLIPPLLIEDTFITNIKSKANIFNNFFSLQCNPIMNNSHIPNTVPYLLNERIDSIEISNNDIIKIIRALNVNKAHGHDNISIRMIKICDEALVKPLSLIFKNCLNTGTFPNVWKKSNVIPIHKKNDKQDIRNYRPVSLLPIFGKIYEKIIFNSIFKFLELHNLLSEKQSGFRPNDSCIYQLLSITHEIFSAFDCNPSLEVRSVFLDISKAFDKVWHEGLLFKLKSMGISGKLLDLIDSFLNERYQRVLLNGQSSDWLPIKAGVPQGSILGPLFFLIYINDLANDLSTNVKMFADDTSLFSIVENRANSAINLNEDLNKISNWAYQWKMSFNPDPLKQAQEVIFSKKINKNNHPDITFNNQIVCATSSQKHLGMILDEKLDFKSHVKEKCSKFNKGVGVIKKLQNILPRKSLLTIYKSFVRPHLDYGDIIYDQPNNDTFCSKLEICQYNAALAISGTIRGTSMTKLYEELGLESLRFRRYFRRLCALFKIQSSKLPNYLYQLVQKRNPVYAIRDSDKLKSYYCRTEYFKNSFFPYTINQWNKLDSSLRNLESFTLFRKKLLVSGGGRPTPNPVYNIHNPLGLKLLTRLRLGLSHLREHKFKYNFQDCINPLCICSIEIESTKHFFLHCHNYDNLRVTLLNDIKAIDESIFSTSDDDIVHVLLYGHQRFTLQENQLIIKASLTFIIESERFKGPLF